MLPRGEDPMVDPLEVEVVVGYIIGLASPVTDATTPLDVRSAVRGDDRGLVVLASLARALSG